MSAETLLDTITEPFIGHGTNGYAFGATGPGIIGVAFNSLASSKITEIEAFMSSRTTIDIGMNFFLMTDYGGLPGNELFLKSFSLGVNNQVLLTSLDWTVTPGTAYWLIAFPNPGTTGVWEFSHSLAGSIAIDANLGFGTIPRVAGGRNPGEFDGRCPRGLHLGDDAAGFAGIGYGVYRRKRLATLAA